MSAARAVLECYPASGTVLVALGNRGGFSGAGLWRAEGVAGPLCLRAWPASGPTPERLRWIHQLMEEAANRAGLPYVPSVFHTREEQTFVAHAGRLWDLTAWMPGQADFRARPTEARLRSACRALARLHWVWARAEVRAGPCPAVAQRLASAQDWRQLVASGWRPDFPRDDADPLAALARRAWQLVGRSIGSVESLLTPWAARSIRLQPCLCDVWHDHVLFQGEEVSGLVDYGGTKINHIAADLARLLGSLIGDDQPLRQAGLRAYRQGADLSAEEEELVLLLDRTGTILGAVNWLRWLYHERRPFEDRQAVVGRLAELITRLEQE
jgi:Ser/Thr protein kinase RdoA (MazF antagonist)